MGSTTQVTIDGVNYTVTWEYTTGAVQAQAVNALQTLLTFLRLQDASAVQSYLQNSSNVTNLRNALQTLGNLVQSGVNNNGQQSFVTISLAQSLDQVFKTLEAAGIDLSFSNPALAQNVTTNQLSVYWNLALQSPSVLQTVQAAMANAQTATRTLQSMVELDYIAYGNQLLADQLGNLQSALNITDKVINTLTDLQGIHNQLQVLSTVSLASLGFNLSALNGAENPTAWIGLYLKAASTAFGKPIVPGLLSGITSAMAPGFASTVHKLLSLRDQLKSEIQQIQALNNNSSQNSLLGRLQSVYNDLVRNLGSTTTASTPLGDLFPGFRNWILDNYSSFGSNNSSLAGAIQSNITNAVTAAQSLNDTQKQTVQQYLTLFQQYYQSASAILTSITQIIERMAQNISR